MSAHTTYPFQPTTSTHETCSYEHIPSQTSTEDQNQSCFAYQCECALCWHRSCGCLNSSDSHGQNSGAEQRIADLELEVRALRSKLRIEKASQAVSSGQIEALSFYLQTAMGDIEALIGLNYTHEELERGVMKTCETARANTHVSRSFLSQMGIDYPLEFAQYPSSDFSDGKGSSSQHIPWTSTSHANPSAVHQAPDSGPTYRPKSTWTQEGKLPSIRQLFGDQPWNQLGPFPQRGLCERQTVFDRVSKVQTLSLPPILHYQGASPRDESGSLIHGPHSPADWPPIPSHTQIHISQSSSPEYWASPSSPVPRSPTPIHLSESPPYQLSSPYQSPRRTSQPQMSIFRPFSPFDQLRMDHQIHQAWTAFQGTHGDGTAIRSASERLQSHISDYQSPAPESLAMGREQVYPDHHIAGSSLNQIQTLTEELQPSTSIHVSHCQPQDRFGASSSQPCKRKSAGRDPPECDGHLGKRIRYETGTNPNPIQRDKSFPPKAYLL